MAHFRHKLRLLREAGKLGVSWDSRDHKSNEAKMGGHWGTGKEREEMSTMIALRLIHCSISLSNARDTDVDAHADTHAHAPASPHARRTSLSISRRFPMEMPGRGQSADDMSASSPKLHPRIIVQQLFRSRYAMEELNRLANLPLPLPSQFKPHLILPLSPPLGGWIRWTRRYLGIGALACALVLDWVCISSDCYTADLSRKRAPSYRPTDTEVPQNLSFVHW
jgi:hypothetical protein